MLKPATDSGVDGKHLRSIVEIDTLSSLSTLSDIIIGPDDDDPPIDMLLASYSFEYVFKKVSQHQLMHVLRPFHSSALDHKLEDIAQEIHTKFWWCLKQKKPIHNYEAYIARMVHNELVSEIRRCTRRSSKQMQALSDNESMLEDTFMLQPSEEIEQGVVVLQRMQQIASAVVTLPPRQRLAITCLLLEKAAHIPLMKDILKLYGVNTTVAWPQDKEKKRVLQASLSAARKTLAIRLHIDIRDYMQPKRRPRRSATNVQ